jgi:lipopolysaccharide biosynthesis glycosyltransferase
MTRTQHVLYATDENYWMPLYVSLFSLLEHNPDVPFHIWILAEAPDDAFVEHAAALDTGLRRLEVTILPVDGALFRDAPLIDWYFTSAVYFRLVMGRLMPDHIDRILYLDADTLVRRSLEELFSTDVDGHVLAAVPELDRAHPARVSLPPGAGYFNSGVLRVNLAEWRRAHVEDACLRYIEQHRDDPDRIMMPDQDALNVVLTGRWRELGAEYNYVEWQRPDFTIEPRIVHFAGGVKPWHYSGRPRYKDEYLRVLKRTPYADYQPPDRNARSIVRKHLAAAVRMLPGGAGVRARVRTRGG